MKLLFDENRSTRLVESLADLYPGSEHVDGLDLGGADDSAVWEYAKAHGFSIVEVQSLLRSAHATVRVFLEKEEETCLLLVRG